MLFGVFVLSSGPGGSRGLPPPGHRGGPMPPQQQGGQPPRGPPPPNMGPPPHGHQGGGVQRPPPPNPMDQRGPPPRPGYSPMQGMAQYFSYLFFSMELTLNQFYRVIIIFYIASFNIPATSMLL